MSRQCYPIVLALFMLLFFPVPAGAEEKIARFEASAFMQPDGSMLVTEHITVQAEGKAIKRGIMRDLPLAWTRPDARNYRLYYELRGVLRDGAPEPVSSSMSADFLSLRIGNPEVELAPGRYTYTISYIIKNHFSRFDEWDELYWNVTGNGWSFPIDEAVFTLFLPDAEGNPVPGPFRSVEFYTGYAGEQGQNARVSGNMVATTAPLRLHQGLTVVYTWDRSILTGAPEPEEYRKLYRAMAPSLATLPLLAGPLAMLLFYGWHWRRMRPTGGMPVVVPLFDPPSGLTPRRFALCA